MRLTEPVAPLSSVTVTTKAKVPLDSGIPVIVPLEESTNPGASAPVAKFQTCGVLPPDAKSFAE
jgi:hypothetical protein